MISQNDLQKAAKDDANREEEEDKASEYQHIIKSISAYRSYDLTKNHLQKTAGNDANRKEEEGQAERPNWVIILNRPTTICAKVPGGNLNNQFHTNIQKCSRNLGSSQLF